MKKIIAYILITIFIGVGILGPLGVKKTEAIQISKPIANTNINNSNEISNKTLRDTVWCTSGFSVNIGGCFAIVGYNFFSLSSEVVGLSGSIFDSLLAFSLDTKIINQNFIQNSWQSMRDFVNMLFILILVVVSISIILDIGSFASTTLIRNVIIVALLVNFSLFATKVVIDVGNISAKGFYDAINIPNSKQDSIIKNLSVENKSISGALISGYNPARLVSVKSFEAWRKNYVEKTKGTQTANFALLFIFLIGIALNLYMAYILFMVSWLFVMRVVWLWILMILSPLAFISFAVPGLEKQGKKWITKLVDNTFGITVFMFLIWLTLRIITNDFMKSAFSVGNDPSLIKLITIVVMQGIMVFVLLKTSLEKTKEMIDDGGLGDKIIGLLKTISTVALGGASFMARGTLAAGAKQSIGHGAKALSEHLQNKGVGTGRFGKITLKTLRKVSDKKFGSKEGYVSQQVSGAQEHKAYIETLPKEYIDKKGNPHNAQKEAREKLEKQNPLIKVMNTVSGGRTGASLYTDYYSKNEKATKELNKLRISLANKKDEAKRFKDDPLKQKKAREEQTEIEGEIKGKEAYLKKISEKMKKPKK